MRNTCINHPAKERLIVVREWQIRACQGNACAAALLSFFEYWHNIRLEQAAKAGEANQVAERHGDAGTQDESLLQFHTAEQLADGLMIYQREAIRDGVKLLENLGFISVHRNPNPRYAFDKTRYFLLNADAINAWLTRSAENSQSIGGKPTTVGGNRETVGGNRDSNKEKTETTYENLNTPLRAREPLTAIERATMDLRAWRREMSTLEDSSATVGASMGLSQAEIDRQWIENARKAAYRAGIPLERITEVLKRDFPNDPNIDLIACNRELPITQ